MVVNAVIIWMFAFLTGASLSRLIVSDKLTAGLRERWQTHWMWHQDRILRQADALLQILRPEATLERMAKLRGEIEQRAALEPGVRLWVGRKARTRARPWSTVRDELDRYSSYAAFLSCRWCTPFWVYLLCAVWTWGRVYGFSAQVLVAAWVPMDWWLVAFVLAARWVYALVDLNLGDH